MKVAVVANGPSAAGLGPIVDACDRVVRMRAWWAHAAEDAGCHCDAMVWFGGHETALEEWPQLHCEHWLSHCRQQLEYEADGIAGSERLSRFLARVGTGRMRWLPDGLWNSWWKYLNRHPSTGFVAVGMALEVYRPTELVLFGFDGVAGAFNDARREIPQDQRDCHDMAAEKRAFCDLERGLWLGQPMEHPPVVVWYGKPEMPT